MDKKPPRLMLLQDIRRVWMSRKELPTVKRWLFFWAGPIAVIELVVFVLTAVEANVKGTSGWQTATEVAVSAEDPFVVHTWIAVVLAITTLFVVPVVIGTAVGLIVEAQTRRMRRPEKDVLKDPVITELLKRVKQLEKREEGQ